MQPVEMQPVEMQPVEMQFGEMQLSLKNHTKVVIYII